ncbi:MAG: TetR/AcrR family transcriptional regulator [Turicibacter sp.]
MVKKIIKGGSSIYTKFLKLPAEKQKIILNAAMREFVKKGYQNASTNEIVKVAGISKGLLFHYFENKKNLFLFLCEHTVEIAYTQFYQKANYNEPDLFKRVKDITLIKLELLHHFPELFSFLSMAFNETHSDVQDELKDKLVMYSEHATSKLFEHVDGSKFKDDLDKQVMINMMMWTYQGFTEMSLSKLNESEQLEQEFYRIFVEIDKYTNTMRRLFYKS